MYYVYTRNFSQENSTTGSHTHFAIKLMIYLLNYHKEASHQLQYSLWEQSAICKPSHSPPNQRYMQYMNSLINQRACQLLRLKRVAVSEITTGHDVINSLPLPQCIPRIPQHSAH